MSAHNLISAMKARTKSVFPSTNKITVTKPKSTILSRGAVEHVECANGLAIKSALKYTQSDFNHANDATVHPTAGDQAITTKKVQWSDETTTSTSATFDNVAGLTTTFEVGRIREQYHTEKSRNKVDTKSLKNLSYTMPCDHHLKRENLKRATMRGLSMSSFKGDIVVTETGKKGESVLSSGFNFVVKSLCRLRKEEVGGFQLKGVKKVSKNEGNGAIFNGGDFRDELGHQFKW